MIWIAILTVIALVLVMPFVREKLKPRMADRARRNAPGAFAMLSRGQTHYRWLGAARGPIAVCVHGLTTPSFVWNGLAPGLGALGFRVLVYDLYGRGYSDRPEGPQDSAFFVTQLEDLLDALEIRDDITLIGYSMGGAIATSFAALYPERLRQLVLIAPAGLGHDIGPVARLATASGILGHWCMQSVFARSFRRATNAERELPGMPEGFVDLQQAELAYRGFVPAVLRSITGMLSEVQDEEHADIALARLPVLAIWGDSDTVIPPTSIGRLAQINRTSRQEVIEGAGHSLVYTHSAEVLEAMRDLMRD